MKEEITGLIDISMSKKETEERFKEPRKREYIPRKKSASKFYMNGYYVAS